MSESFAEFAMMSLIKSKNDFVGLEKRESTKMNVSQLANWYISRGCGVV